MTKELLGKVDPAEVLTLLDICGRTINMAQYADIYQAAHARLAEINQQIAGAASELKSNS